MSSPQRLIGQTIGKYKIVEILGRGGMAEVYKAYQESLDRHVAIKLMHSFLADEEGFLSRFQREARAMATLSHTNIVSVYDFDVQNGTYYIVMEFVSGGTLKQTLEGMAALGERMPLSRTVQIVLEIADALAYAHSRGMVHRDIKPANIMINDDGRAVLTDFGIAKILSGPSFTATGAMIGTPAYMSPEQGLGQPGDERSDIYALGVLFFQMATGRLPYDADTPLAVILKHVNEPIPESAIRDSEIPEAIHKVLLKSMAKDPEERYQTAHEMANDLRAAIRVSNMETGAFIPSELLQDRPTPPPMRTMPVGSSGGLTEIVMPASSTPEKAQATQVGAGSRIDQTDISVPAELPKARSRTPLVIAGIIVLIVLGAVVGGIVLANRGNGAETPTSQPVAVAEETDTPEPPTEEPEEQGEEQATIDIGATAEAAVALALTAQAEGRPTDTPLPSPTVGPTATPTPNMTATFLANCETEIELVNYYVYDNQTVQAAPENSDFPITWVLENSGSCPIMAGSAWEYVEGEEFDENGPIILEADWLPREEITITIEFTAPGELGTYESTWQFVDAVGNTLGEPITFEIFVYELVTQTPAASPGSATPAATTTSQATASPLDFSYNVSNCEYVGSQWQCVVTFVPIGGVGPYRLTVSDRQPPAVYNGNGPFSHTIVSGRCFPWINNVRLEDTGTGQVVSRDVFISPDPYFPGGCNTGP